MAGCTHTYNYIYLYMRIWAMESNFNNDRPIPKAKLLMERLCAFTDAHGRTGQTVRDWQRVVMTSYTPPKATSATSLLLAQDPTKREDRVPLRGLLTALGKDLVGLWEVLWRWWVVGCWFLSTPCVTIFAVLERTNLWLSSRKRTVWEAIVAWVWEYIVVRYAVG